jgi:hypothetical protein
MKFKTSRTLFGLVLLSGFGALALNQIAGTALAAERSGTLQLTKNCKNFTVNPGAVCTITASNFPEIKVGSVILYDYPNNLPTLTGLLDTNVVLNVGTGYWAVGRCTLDNTTNLGLCTFSDGAGPLAGFHARLHVSSSDGINYTLFGTYSFNSDPDR